MAVRRVLKFIMMYIGSCAVLCSHSLAWTGDGHARLAEWTLQNLNQNQQQYYVALAKQINTQASVSDVEAFTYLSVFADKMRDDSLEVLFGKFNAPVPKTLFAQRNSTTSNWHYYNNVLNADNCDFENHGRLVDGMKLLHKTLKEDLSKKQEALVLGLQLHFIQDSHQPLHTVTRLDKQCRSDRGGNGKCIHYKKDGVCELNLHQLWDRGFGIFRLKRVALENIKKYDLTFRPLSWVNESKKYYAHDYELDSPTYTSDARKIVNVRAQLAVERSLVYLDEHFKRRSNR